MTKIKAIIFDFDGLMVNTHELLAIAYDEFLKRRGKRISREDHAQLSGRTGVVNMKWLKEKYGLEGDPEDLYEERKEITKSLFEQQMVLMEGVVELLDRAKLWGLKCAIGSGTRGEVVLPALEKFGLAERFETVVTKEDLVKSEGKPDPESFLIVAQRLGVAPGECVVLEDSPFGIQAAKAAGMKAVFVPNTEYIDRENDQADVILEDLHGFTDEILEKLNA